jgi:hypothetical protein
MNLRIRLGLVLFLAGCSIAYSQEAQRAETAVPNAPQITPQASSPGPLQFQKVVTLDGASRDQLYDAALAWFTRMFQRSKEVIQVNDRQSGTLIGKSLFEYHPVVFIASGRIAGVVRYTLTVEVKDGRYRYTIDSFVHEGSPLMSEGPLSFGLLTTVAESAYTGGITRSAQGKTWADLKRVASAEADTVANSLRKSLATAAAQKAW